MNYSLAISTIRLTYQSICLVTDRNYLKSILLAGIENRGPNFGRPEWFENVQEDMWKVLVADQKELLISSTSPLTIPFSAHPRATGVPVLSCVGMSYAASSTM
jgi:hypothetical protein